MASSNRSEENNTKSTGHNFTQKFPDVLKKKKKEKKKLRSKGV
jgi:hypothetical protein